jgi:hypothetical protein
VKINTISVAREELATAERQYEDLLRRFTQFAAHAQLLAGERSPCRGITIIDSAPTAFTVKFLDRAVRFSFEYVHDPSRGVLLATDVSARARDDERQFWIMRFDGVGKLEGVDQPEPGHDYSLQRDVDCMEIVLAAIVMKLKTGTRLASDAG